MSTTQPQEIGATSLALIQAAIHSSAAVRDILAERSRQVVVEGYTLHHDDHQAGSAMADAAGLLARNAYAPSAGPPACWPWEARHWKPKDPRTMLVQAAALLIAEIERLDRAGGVPISVRLTAEQLEDLRRFRECCNDGECYDVPVERMRALAALGMVREEHDIEPDHYALTDAGRATLVAAAREPGQ